MKANATAHAATARTLEPRSHEVWLNPAFVLHDSMMVSHDFEMVCTSRLPPQEFFIPTDLRFT
eukprot:284301-Amphidinium_carterae.1